MSDLVVFILEYSYQLNSSLLAYVDHSFYPYQWNALISFVKLMGCYCAFPSLVS